MLTLKQAKNKLKNHLVPLLGDNLKGVGISSVTTIAVRVATEKDKKIVPTSWEGFNVECLVVGDLFKF
jgi:hypothetical protein